MFLHHADGMFGDSFDGFGQSRFVEMQDKRDKSPFHVDHKPEFWPVVIRIVIEGSEKAGYGHS